MSPHRLTRSAPLRSLARFARRRGLRWPEESLRNALSWLVSTEAWARGDRSSDESRQLLIQQVADTLPDGSVFEFEHLLTAKEVFVRNLLKRPCGRDGFADAWRGLASVVAPGEGEGKEGERERGKVGQEAGVGDDGDGVDEGEAEEEPEEEPEVVKDRRRLRSSVGHHASEVSRAASQLELARLVLSQTTQAIADGSKAPHGLPPAAKRTKREEAIEAGAGAPSTGSDHNDHWTALLRYLLSWKVVCLSSMLMQHLASANEGAAAAERAKGMAGQEAPTPSASGPARGGLAALLFPVQEGGRRGGSKHPHRSWGLTKAPSGQALECACILLLSHAWYDLLRGAHSRSFRSLLEQPKERPQQSVSPSPPSSSLFFFRQENANTLGQMMAFFFECAD